MKYNDNADEADYDCTFHAFTTHVRLALIVLEHPGR
jgi:hypothetical protein